MAEVSPELRATALAAVALDGRALRDLPRALRGDPEVVAVAVRQSGVALQFAAEALADDEGVARPAVEQTWVALEFVSERLRGDRGLVALAIRQSGLALKDAAEELRADPELVGAAVERDGCALAYAADDLRADKALVERACDQNPQALQFAAAELQEDLELILPCLRRDGSAYRFVGERARRDRDVLLDALDTYGMALRWAPPTLQADREVVAKAVSHTGAALAFACEGLRGDDRIVREAARQDPQALEHASWELRNDRELVLDIVDRDGSALRWAADLRDDQEVVMLAVKGCGLALGDASVRLREDKETCLRAVRQDGKALLFVAACLRGDRDILLAAVGQHGAALAHAPDQLVHDAEVCRTALAQDGRALAFVPQQLRRDRETVIAAVSQHGAALQYAPYELRGDVEVAVAALGQGGAEAVEFLSVDLKKDAALVEFALEEHPVVPGRLQGRPRPWVRKVVLAKARRFMEPVIAEEHKLSWLEALTALRLVSPISELQVAFGDPAAFVQSLAKGSPAVAKAWVLACLKPALRKELSTLDVAWEDLRLALDGMQVSELEMGLANPKQFVEDLAAKRAGHAAKWLAIARLRSGLAPLLPQGLPWEDVARVLDVVETPKELKDFHEGGPDLLFWKLRNGGEWPAAQAYSKALLRLTVSPMVPGDPKPYWEDFARVLAELKEEGAEGVYDEEDTLKWALADLRRFLRRQREDPHLRTAKLWAFAQLHPLVEEELEKQGNTWEEVLPLLEEMDTMRELQPALDKWETAGRQLLDRLAVGTCCEEDHGLPTSAEPDRKVWEKW